MGGRTNRWMPCVSCTGSCQGFNGSGEGDRGSHPSRKARSGARLACPPEMWAGPPWPGVWGVRVRVTHVHLCIRSQQLGPPFKGSPVFL